MKYIAMDLDGTMLDFMSYWRKLAHKYLKSRNLTVDEELNKKLNSMPSKIGRASCRERV